MRAAPSAILGPSGQPYRAQKASPPGRRNLRAKYDAAQTIDENRRWWANADSLSARAAHSPEVRRVLRERARYEVGNNSYAAGILLTLANDMVGMGPQLQLETDDEDLNEEVEMSFMAWADAIDLAGKLRTMRMARACDGEVFGLFITNDRLRTPVKLDLRLIEADQVATPTFAPIIDPNTEDGIEFDGADNPTFYHVLRDHPGDLVSFGTAFGEFDRVPAELVLHWFRCDRPGQLRGVPEITPALPLFALLRRYTLATVVAAEIAAEFPAVLESTLPPDDQTDPLPDFDTTEIERGVLTTLPEGYKLNQLQPTQPTTTYPEFKKQLLNEIARCLNMPFGTASGNYEGFNYSSGRLDHLLYTKSIKVDQAKAKLVILDELFAAWLDEASRVGMVPAARGRLGDWPHMWLWPGTELVDPQNEASALEILLRNDATSLTDHYGSLGLDWRSQLRKRAKERAYQRDLEKEFGLTPAPQPSASPSPSGPPSRNGQPSPNGAGNGQAN